MHVRLPRYLQSHGQCRERPHRQGTRFATRCPIRPASFATKLLGTCADFVHGPQRLLHPLRRVGPKGSGPVRAHLMGCGAGRDPRADERDYQPVGSAGGDAAELCRDRMACSPATACRRGFSTGWAPPSSTGGRCAAACAAKRGPGLMAPCPVCPPEFAEHARSSMSSGATTRLSPTSISCAASARRSAPAASWS